MGIANYCDQDGKAWPKIDTLATMLGLSHLTVSRNIKRLVVRGLLIKEDRKNNSSIYELQMSTHQIDISKSTHQNDMSKPLTHQNDTPDPSKRYPKTVLTHQNDTHILSSDNPIIESESYSSDWPSDDIPTEDDKSTITVNDFIESWNDEFKDKLPLVRLPLSESRKRKVAARLGEHPDMEFWTKVWTNICTSSFLLGNNGKGDHERWRCTLDFVTANDRNCVKIWEGQYNREQNKTKR